MSLGVTKCQDATGRALQGEGPRLNLPPNKTRLGLRLRLRLRLGNSF